MNRRELAIVNDYLIVKADMSLERDIVRNYKRAIKQLQSKIATRVGKLARRTPAYKDLQKQVRKIRRKYAHTDVNDDSSTETMSDTPKPIQNGAYAPDSDDDILNPRASTMLASHVENNGVFSHALVPAASHLALSSCSSSPDLEEMLDMMIDTPTEQPSSVSSPSASTSSASASTSTPS